MTMLPQLKNQHVYTTYGRQTSLHIFVHTTVSTRVELNSLPPIILHPAAHIKWFDICVNMVGKGVYVRVTAGMCVAGVKCLPEYIYIFPFILKILRGKDRIYLGKCVSLLIYSKFGKAYVNEMQGDNSLYTFIQSNCRYTSVGVNFNMVLYSEL